ncbi:adenine deaminase [sulfur-oxidizing endosymbiont of Gigantopelta aegis]|uniref:adenine deaminase n=1 Tax=sulfur-oxidizing endosymbiont of Gigantopelta aegis TaxID=2794934 RepID=UPI0018DC8316|nr:adenine deaminase [sulfur-oxidizing endosymbiont of Gigantopelta aegis]
MPNEQVFELKVNLLDFSSRTISSNKLSWQQGIISHIETLGAEDPGLDYLLPGFIDAHVHIESSMLLPSEFARLAVRHGTIATVSDPHEIANVLGIQGVEFMLSNADKTPFNVFFGAPSCVPATPFETAGAEISLADIETLFASSKVKYLSEMMNFPGVLSSSPEVMAKLALAKKYGFPIDGHAPGLVSDKAAQYAQAGISTDHECTSLAEARDKIAAGMKILIREGSAARDFTTLHPLISEYPDKVMFCSDDKHPDQLYHGHINELVIAAVALGHNVFDVLTCACITPVEHYQLPLACLQTGQAMDAVLVDNLKDFTVKSTWLGGEKVAQQGQTLLASVSESAPNCFKAKKVALETLEITASIGQIRVIDVCEGKLFTQEKLCHSDDFKQQIVTPDKLILSAKPDNDIAQLTVLNRYQENALPANAFVTGTGIQSGAIASTVAHDSHNIIAIGCDIVAIQKAINTLIDIKGGICVVDKERVHTLALPVAGLMSLDTGENVAREYEQIDHLAKSLGFTLTAPFMTLSFLALLVIPELKLSDKGLFDGRDFSFKTLNV